MQESAETAIIAAEAAAEAEAIENEDLTGIADGVEITSVTEILGLEASYCGYQLKITIKGFNQGLYED